MKSIKHVLKHYQLMLHKKNLKNVWEITYKVMRLFNNHLNNFLRNPNFNEQIIKKQNTKSIQAALYSFILSIN